MRLKRPLIGLVISAALMIIGSTSAQAASSQFLGSHSMLYNNSPYSAKEEMFRQAKESGATTIRVDVFLQGIFLKGFWGDPNIYWQNWSEVDQYKTLAEKYDIKLLGVILGTPYYNVDCPSGTSLEESYKCPPKDLNSYKDMVAAVAQRYNGVFDYYEIINEPDLAIKLDQDPVRYGRILATAADAIHQNSSAKVVSGGLARMGSTGLQYFDSMLNGNSGLAAKIDICNIHIRGSSTSVVSASKTWDNKCQSKGIGQLWVTEYGYPASTSYQGESTYKTGESGQAKFIQDTLPKMVMNGGDKVFVTLRDWGGGWFATEGILDTDDPLVANPTVRRRAAFTTVQNLFPAPPDNEAAEAVARRYSWPGAPLATLTTSKDIAGGFRRYRASISPCYIGNNVQDNPCPARGAYAEVAVNSSITIVSYLVDDRLLYTRGGLTSDTTMASWSHLSSTGANITSSATIEGHRSAIRSAFSQAVNRQKLFFLSPLALGNQSGVAINFSSESDLLGAPSQRIMSYFPAPTALSPSFSNLGSICLPGQRCNGASLISSTLSTGSSMFSVQKSLTSGLANRNCGQTDSSDTTFIWQQATKQQVRGLAKLKTICL